MSESTITAAALLAGSVVGYILSGVPHSSSLLDVDASYSSIATVVNGVLLIAVVAAVSAAVPVPARARLGVALASLILIALGAIGAVPDSLAPWTTPAAAGALLGATALLAGNARSAQAALVLGVIGVGALGSSVDELLRYIPPATSEFGWTANAIPVDQGLPERTLIIVALTIVTGVLLALARNTHTVASSPRLLGVGVLLPLTGSVLAWTSTSFRSETAVWYSVVAGLTVAALVAAFVLRGRDGAFVLALFATTGAAFGSATWSESGWGQLSALLGLLVVGAAVGYYLPNVHVGFGLLALGPITALLFDGDTMALLSFLLFPLAMSYVTVSALSVSTGVAVLSAVVPFTMTVSVTVYVASTEFGSGFEVESFVGNSNPSASTLSIAGLAVVAVCAAGVAVVRRRA